MEVRFTPEVEAQLTQVATSAGKNPEQFVAETMTKIVSERARFLAAVQLGIESADRGEFVEHEEVAARIARRFR